MARSFVRTDCLQSFVVVVVGGGGGGSSSSSSSSSRKIAVFDGRLTREGAA
jgi:hypothetical protein